VSFDYQRLVRLSKNFTHREMRCRCCDELLVSPWLLIGLEWLRDLIVSPIRVHSAYRCVQHNQRVGGVPNSQHILGNAADISTPTLSPKQLAMIAAEVPHFGGIGLYQNFVHVDIRPTKSRWGRLPNGEFLTWVQALERW